jgi:hypothetical protein
MTEERASWYATGVFAVTAIGALGISALRGIAAVVAVALFVAGAVMMAAALVIGAGRSRTEAIDVGGLFFSQAPRSLKLALAAQTVIGLATAAARPNTGAALGVLVPIAGLGLCSLWGARHGRFPARDT